MFECPAYVHISSEERSKLDVKSRQCILLEYQKGLKGFKVWDLKTNKVIISIDVIFNEKIMLQCTQEKKKRVSKNYNINEHVMQAELEKKIFKLLGVLAQEISSITI